MRGQPAHDGFAGRLVPEEVHPQAVALVAPAAAQQVQLELPAPAVVVHEVGAAVHAGDRLAHGTGQTQSADGQCCLEFAQRKLSATMLAVRAGEEFQRLVHVRGLQVARTLGGVQCASEHRDARGMGVRPLREFVQVLRGLFDERRAGRFGAALARGECLRDFAQTRPCLPGGLGVFAGERLVVLELRLQWAAPVPPDTLDGNMCSGGSDGNEKEVHGRVQA